VWNTQYQTLLTCFGYLQDETHGSTDMSSPLCSNFMCLMQRLHKEPVSIVKTFCLLSVITNLEGKQYINPLVSNNVFCVAGFNFLTTQHMCWSYMAILVQPCWSYVVLLFIYFLIFIVEFACKN
jgi:hypothetical protein